MVEREIFGPKLWATMHFVSLGYPKNPSENDKKNYRAFYENIVNVIPCDECSKHLRDNLKKVDIQPFLESRKLLFEWTVKLHNTVNIMLGKPEWSLTYAYNYYNNYSNLNESMKCFTNKNVISIILIILLIIVLLYKTDYVRNILKKITK